jgi:hypothetical protein
MFKIRFAGLLVALFCIAFFAASTATAHRPKVARSNKVQCETIKDKKKRAACKGCMTRWKGKRHYHPHAKAGSRCH